MLPLMHLEHISQLRAEWFFIVKWEICSDYCNPIVRKISRALSTFSLQKLILVRKSRMLTPHSSFPDELCPGHAFSWSHHSPSPEGCKMCPGAQCTELEPLLVITRVNKDRFTELLMKRLTSKSKCIV